MNAIETARNVIEEFGTANVFVIAKRSNVRIVYGSWHPVTMGEYDKRTKTICVNRRALENEKRSEQKIVAHELGHFFAGQFDLDKKAEEIFACQFADELTKPSELRAEQLLS